jgi:hypothetical protein
MARTEQPNVGADPQTPAASGEQGPQDKASAILADYSAATGRKVKA